MNQTANRRSSTIFRVNRNVKIKDEELPFTKAVRNLKSPPSEFSTISKVPDILQKTYYKAFPVNRKPLSKLSTQPTLATYNPILEKSPTTKFCHFNEPYLNCLQKLNHMEENQDIAKSIKRTASVGDYHKTSGYFFLSKTSQNYSNTIEALSNFDKAKVMELDLWYKRKIEKSLKNSNTEKLFSIQADNQEMDPETLLKDKLIQRGEVQEILSATHQQLKSVLKQKAEMFQPGKSLDFRNKEVKTLNYKNKKLNNLQKMTNFIKSGDYGKLVGKDGKPLIKIQDDQEIEEETSEVENEEKVLEDVVIKPLKKKELWEMKEKATKLEVTMQYQISKLEEEISNLKTKLEWTRRDNCLIGEKLKKKQTKVSTYLLIHQKYLKGGLTIDPQAPPDSAKLRASPGGSSNQSPTLLRGASKISDFMKKQGRKDSFRDKQEKHLRQLSKLKKLQEENLVKIKEIEDQLAKLRLDLVEAKHKQVDHYKSLLSTGLDARKDGLIWIIKTLWLLKQDIQIQTMPRFLDSECIKFLLEYAKLDIKRNELHTVLKEMKFKAKEKRLNDVFKLKMSQQQSQSSPKIKGSPSRRQLSIFSPPDQSSLKMSKALTRKQLFSLKTKEEILKSAKEQLHEMSQTIQAVNLSQEDPEELEILLQLQQEDEESESYDSDDELGDILPQFRNKGRESILKRQNSLIKFEKIDQHAKSANEQEALDQKSSYVEREYNALKNKMRVMKNFQLDRIGREFLLNNYEKRFKVSQEIVLAAIVGEDKAKAAANNQVKKQEEYKRIIEKNRTFTFASLRQSNLPAQRITINTLKQ